MMWPGNRGAAAASSPRSSVEDARPGPGVGSVDAAASRPSRGRLGVDAASSERRTLSRRIDTEPTRAEAPPAPPRWTAPRPRATSKCLQREARLPVRDRRAGGWYSPAEPCLGGNRACVAAVQPLPQAALRAGRSSESSLPSGPGCGFGSGLSSEQRPGRACPGPGRPGRGPLAGCAGPERRRAAAAQAPWHRRRAAPRAAAPAPPHPPLSARASPF